MSLRMGFRSHWASLGPRSVDGLAAGRLLSLILGSIAQSAACGAQVSSACRWSCLLIVFVVPFVHIGKVVALPLTFQPDCLPANAWRIEASPLATQQITGHAQ